MRPLAIAHRAGNDVTALRAATELGVDVVEADVHAWQRRLEVRHSKALGPWLWERPGLDGRRLEWIPPSAPRLLLPALLAAVSPDTALMLDLKGVGGASVGGLGTKVAQAVEARRRTEPTRGGRREAPILVCGRWWPYVDAVARYPWARPVLSARNSRELSLLRRRLAGAGRPYGVSVHRPLLTAMLVRELHERVEVVMTWPVNDATALEHVLACAVTGVISDCPEILRAVRTGS